MYMQVYATHRYKGAIGTLACLVSFLAPSSDDTVRAPGLADTNKPKGRHMGDRQTTG